MRRIVVCAIVVAVALALAGCKAGDIGAGFSPPPATKAAPRLITGWEPGCTAALASAATAPVFERFGIIAAGCPVCGVAWDAALLSAVLDEHGTSSTTRKDFDHLLRACGGVCRSTSVEKVLDGLDDIKDERTLDKPWRVLAKECPDAFAASPDGRLASAPWYVLTKIARAPGIKPAAAIELPVPAAMVGGADGLDLPGLPAVRPELPASYLTVLETGMRLAPAGRVVLGSDGLITTAVDKYPGDKVAIETLDDDLAGRGVVAILAPHASRAARVVEAIEATKETTELYLGVFGPDAAAHAGWHRIPRLAPLRLRWTGPGGTEPIVVGLVGGGRVGRFMRNTVVACELPPGEIDQARIIALLDAVERGMPAPRETHAMITVGPEAEVDALAWTLGELSARGITEVTVRTHDPELWTASQPCGVP